MSAIPERGRTTRWGKNGKTGFALSGMARRITRRFRRFKAEEKGLELARGIDRMNIDLAEYERIVKYRMGVRCMEPADFISRGLGIKTALARIRDEVFQEMKK